MMIQRYDDYELQPSDDGAWVKYADHVQAMEAEAESAHDLGVIYGINHERARIRQAVEALPRVAAFVDELAIVRLPHVLSIIDGTADA